MWLIYDYWIFIAVMFVVILLFVLRYSGTNRMTFEVAVEFLRTGGPLEVAPHEVDPGIMVVSNDAIRVLYSRHKEAYGLHEHIAYSSVRKEFLGDQCIHVIDGLVMSVQRENCAARSREQISYHEKMQCGHIIRIVSTAIDRSKKK